MSNKFKNLTDRKAVLKALEEFDRLRREPFLSKYGFKEARTYYLYHNGTHYDSKAIIGVAYGYQFGAPLKSGEFNGGINTVVPKLRELGFEVIEIATHETDEFQKQIQASLKDKRGRAARLAMAKRIPDKYAVVQLVFRRNADVVAEVLERASAHCESCKRPAPFRRTSNGSPYLEVHHKKTLADGGEDTVENAIALCPNCHRKEHHGVPQLP
jgi:5-methylcytosine-specific restriction protein A